ncbi:C-type lectin domain family 4 member F-like [Drosophila kikkawai]|uniref:C-type lectin domain family 4 member F-like n=1 Tax=Drosophila kikkawai TaxID=30033 RepID=A0A6P4IK39_DROKI|nr:CD209 antigen-like protein B [Drosophila kikkawai]
MHNFGIFFWALAACILRQGLFAEDQSGYICLIENPEQNQCDSICLTEVSPRLSEIVQAQNEGNTNTRDAVNEIKSKLETLEVNIGEVQLRERLRSVENTLNRRLQGVESKLERHLQEMQTKVEAKLAKSLHEVNTKLEGQLQGLQEGQTKLEAHQTKMEAKLEDSQLAVKTKLEGQLQGVENKLEGRLQEVQTKLQAKLDESVQAVQKMIENQLQLVVNQLQAVPNKIDAAKVETQVHPISNKTAASEQAAKAAVPASATTTIPSGFELIGTRYFRIVYERVEWRTAMTRCREMGGYLAAFRNEEEINAITPKLDWNGNYWLGINDLVIEGYFVSVASDKPAQFLKFWRKSDDKYHDHNCVYLRNGGMLDAFCNRFMSFICQADNET